MQEAAKDAAARMKNAQNDAGSIKSDLDTLEHDASERVSTLVDTLCSFHDSKHGNRRHLSVVTTAGVPV